MKTVESQLSITRRSNADGGHSFNIEITDKFSGVRTAQCLVSAENLALALSGFSSQESEAVVYDRYDTFGKNRQTKKVSMEKPDSYDRAFVADAVKNHYLDSGAAAEGWKIHSDGTREQQNSKCHVYTLIRFVGANQ